LGGNAGAAPSGTMTFYDGPTALTGAVTYTSVPPAPAVLSSLNASMPYTPTIPGLHNINVSYSGDTNYLPASTSVAATLTVIGPDFSLTPASITDQSVNAGQTATFTNSIVVAASNGFNSQVNLSCALPAMLATCSVNPASLSSGNGMATVTVATTARGLAPQLFLIGRFGRDAQPLLVLLITWLLALTLMRLFSLRSERERRLFPIVGFALILALVAIGCGGGSSGTTQPPAHPGTPLGTYLITVTGTSGNLTHTATLSLTVK
jgi:hypothetical protein